MCWHNAYTYYGAYKHIICAVNTYYAFTSAYYGLLEHLFHVVAWESLEIPTLQLQWEVIHHDLP
jgi:hypothetical protein